MPLRHKPKFDYSGLTIIMSQPSRHDKNKLIDGVAGYFFNNECLSPQINRFQCDIRLISDTSPLYPGTKVILLLGQKAFYEFTKISLTLSEARGSPYIINNIVCIPSFAPQDAIDPRDFESKFNKEASEEEDFDSEGEDYVSEKGRNKTSRSNYRFWLKQDTKKAIKILENNGIIPEPEIQPEYIIAPTSDEIIEILSTTKNKNLYIDIETDIYSLDMRCFSFGIL